MDVEIQENQPESIGVYMSQIDQMRRYLREAEQEE